MSKNMILASTLTSWYSLTMKDTSRYTPTLTLGFLLHKSPSVGEHILSWSIIAKFYFEIEMLPLALLSKTSCLVSSLCSHPKKRSNFIKCELKHLVELVSFEYLLLNLLGWTQKDEGSKQQGSNHFSKTSFNIGVHSEVRPNIYTRLLMSSDIKVLVWGRCLIHLFHLTSLRHFGTLVCTPSTHSSFVLMSLIWLKNAMY